MFVRDIKRISSNIANDDNEAAFPKLWITITVYLHTIAIETLIMVMYRLDSKHKERE